MQPPQAGGNKREPKETELWRTCAGGAAGDTPHLEMQQTAEGSGDVRVPCNCFTVVRSQVRPSQVKGECVTNLHLCAAPSRLRTVHSRGGAWQEADEP